MKNPKHTKIVYSNVCYVVLLVSSSMTKWPVYKQTHRTAHKHAEHQDVTDIQKTNVFVFRIVLFLFIIYDFINDFSKKRWVTALVRSMTFIGGLNQFSAIANWWKPHTYSTYQIKLKTKQNLNINNINGRDVQRKNVVNNVDKSSLWAPWQNGPYKNTQNKARKGKGLLRGRRAFI